MFTGLVEGTGRVDSLQRLSVGLRFAIAFPAIAADGQIGESIAVNGCCLTVVACDGSSFCVEAGTETLSRTNLGRLSAGDPVNLERSMTLTARLGGHFVSGHIDYTARLLDRKDEADWSLVRVELPERWRSQVAAKGSIAVDGVSLTVVDVLHDSFTVALIPHTLQQTIWQHRQPGAMLNIETDLLAKYVEAALQHRGQAPGGS